MPPKSKKVEAVEAAPVVVEKTDTTDADLLALYLKERQKQRSDLTEFTHAKYESWLHYFGFSLEQEMRWGGGSKQARSRSLKKASFVASMGGPGGGAKSPKSFELPRL
jgi:hypothetical protein